MIENFPSAPSYLQLMLPLSNSKAHKQDLVACNHGMAILWVHGYVREYLAHSDYRLVPYAHSSSMVACAGEADPC